jgi:hypothetical protein
LIEKSRYLKAHIEFESKDGIPLPYAAISTIPIIVTIQPFATAIFA